MHEIDGQTQLCALIGDPVEHSVSPAMHNAAFSRLKLNFRYLAFRVHSVGLRAAVLGLKEIGVRGLNVTAPHKIEVMKYLDRIEVKAREIGAVNTVVNLDGTFAGYNTDGVGAKNALKAAIRSLEGHRIVLLGSGGSAKAIAFELAPHASRMIILSRNHAKARKLASKIRKRFGIRSVGLGLTRHIVQQHVPSADLLIHATPTGQIPSIKRCLVDQEALNPNQVVFDLVYNPLETVLLKRARQSGAKTVSGIEMLVHQAAASFRLWTLRRAPIGAMRDVALDLLQR